jgi:hypothetical protein
MYYYVITTGQYSNYGLEGIVASETPIDIKAKLDELTAWLNDNLSSEERRSAYLEDEEKDAAFQAIGLVLVDYEETNYDLVYGWGDSPDAAIAKPRPVDTAAAPC